MIQAPNVLKNDYECCWRDDINDTDDDDDVNDDDDDDDFDDAVGNCDNGRNVLLVGLSGIYIYSHTNLINMLTLWP